MFDGVVLGIIIATVAGVLKDAVMERLKRKELECCVAPGEKVVSYDATVIVGENGDVLWIDNKHGIKTL